MIDADSYLGYLFSFDMSYFMNSGVDINAYSPAVKKLYSKALSNCKLNYRPNMPNRNGKWVHWTPMMPDDAFVFKFNRQFAGSVPPLLSSMIDYSKIDKYKELEDVKKELGVSLKETKDGILQTRDAMDVLRDLSVEYNKLEENDLRRTDLLNSVGGKLRANALDAILKNYDMYSKC